MKKDIKIFVCHHKVAPIFQSKYIIPIHVGKEMSKISLDMIGDNTGDNISNRNYSWCELSAIYWMWKNIQADYYGLFHYRRYLNFNSIGGGYDIFNQFDKDTCKAFGWEDEKIENICSQYDIITSPIWSIHPVGLPNYHMTNYDFYAKEHYQKDIDIVISIIKEKYPDIYPYVLKSLYSKECFFANMMIMKKEYFNDYCSWLFDILFEAEKRINIENYDSYQKRIWGFLAERLSNCYLEYIKANELSLKYTSLGMVFGIFDKNEFSRDEIENNISKNRLTSLNLITAETINVVFAIDNNYAKYCAIAIESILDNLNSKQKIHFFIVHDNSLSELSKGLLSNYENTFVKISYLKVKVSDFSFYPLNREHISIATYYRLSLQELLPTDVNKVIYLDSDIIVLDNLSKLWEIDLEDNYLAGGLDEGGILQIRRLGLPLSHNYINAGICVMNIKKMREINLQHLYSETLYKNYELIILQDQDILNIAFVNKIKKLPLRWNVQSRFYKQNELEYAFSQKELKDAALNPAIVHFSDRQKPWQQSCRHTLKPYYKLYESKLSNEWNIPNNPTLSDFISYEIRGDKVNIYISFNERTISFTLNKKFARSIFRFMKYISRFWSK